MLNYAAATWHIRIAHHTFVEISIRGCQHDRESVSACEVTRAASVLRELSRAIDRIATRWKAVESATPVRAVAPPAPEEP